MKAKVKQFIENNKLKGSYTPNVPVKVTNLKAAKRLLAKLIYDLQTDKIDNQKAKDLTYLLVSYVNIFKQYELELRIEEIEKQLNR
ncbi:MAG TPA: hypothetical protein PKD03_01645 [Ignavibacteriaceae bacterium]|nr:hypothetical protein [Ignavibacteriaceae bacterium]